MLSVSSVFYKFHSNWNRVVLVFNFRASIVWMEPNQELKSFVKLLKMERIWLSSQNSMHMTSAMFSSCISARYGIERSDGKPKCCSIFLQYSTKQPFLFSTPTAAIKQVPCITAMVSLFTWSLWQGLGKVLGLQYVFCRKNLHNKLVCLLIVDFFPKTFLISEFACLTWSLKDSHVFASSCRQMLIYCC